MELKKLEFTSCRRTSHDDLPGETADERLGQALIRMGALTPEAYDAARTIHRRQDCVFSQTLFARGYVTKSELRAALEQIWNCQTVDLDTSPPDPRLMQQLGHATCLKYKILPWKSLSGGTVFATSDPQGFDAFLDVLPKEYGIPFLAIATEAQLIGTIQSHFEPQLTFGAETRVPEDESCRRWRKPFLSVGITAVLACLIAGLMLFPTLLLGVICGWAVFTLIASSSLKMAAAIMHRKPMRKTADHSAATPLASARMPCVSVLVPLFKEQEIATHLIARLQKLEYPRELLDICLIVENDDTLTKECITRSELPSWARVIVVPEGSIRTKPRALNYALDFCRGSIVGIYDAEDAPAHDQIKKIVEAFQNNGPEVACVQGVLDFYNARTNWLSRCFAIEYATWFRVILPGMLRLGLAIPLGGTTMFFRREAIEKLGGWDAHNVTEDADLGIRLARHGYSTQLIQTVTQEEANCRYIPWIKQRSRWLKGYALTWAVHMRAPKMLLQQLGWWKFIGFQITFLGALSQFFFAPALWSFWAIPFGYYHPLSELLSSATIWTIGVIFFTTEIATILISMRAVSRTQHQKLKRWVPTLHFYYPLAALASYKGFYEILTRPFYWDKTDHGAFQPNHIHITDQDG